MKKKGGRTFRLQGYAPELWIIHGRLRYRLLTNMRTAAGADVYKSGLVYRGGRTVESVHYGICRTDLKTEAMVIGMLGGYNLACKRVTTGCRVHDW